MMWPNSPAFTLVIVPAMTMNEKAIGIKFFLRIVIPRCSMGDCQVIPRATTHKSMPPRALSMAMPKSQARPVKAVMDAREMATCRKIMARAMSLCGRFRRQDLVLAAVESCSRSDCGFRRGFCRDGQWQSVAAADLAHVRVGNIVPADLQLSDGQILVDQSALTCRREGYPKAVCGQYPACGNQGEGGVMY